MTNPCCWPHTLGWEGGGRIAGSSTARHGSQGPARSHTQDAGPGATRPQTEAVVSPLSLMNCLEGWLKCSLQVSPG